MTPSRAARRRPRAQQRHDDLLRAGMELAGERVTEAALAAGGSPHAAAGARAFNALADGFLLGHLADPQPGDEEALREALRSLAIVDTMPDDERWRARLARPVA